MVVLAALLSLALQDAQPKPVPPVCDPVSTVTEDCLRPLDPSDTETVKPDATYGFQNYPRDEAIMDAVNAQRDAELGEVEPHRDTPGTDSPY